ncbi:hypothetical protein C1H46_037638 [Malus baccata]|uniref:Uncharacterized protein n=1 Tax=Malus baccata TaxID=106549 RepID=A0A540KS42_MALBA|nr:hypothetical protein C1H46_037638 [Malus baccata]
MLLSELKDEVDAKNVVAGISTTCSQKINNRLKWVAVGLEQGGIHQGSGNGVTGSSATLSGNERLPGSVLLTRERLLERLRWMPHSEQYSLTVVNTKVQAWQEEVDRARQGQRDAGGKLSFLEEHMELEKCYRELTDLLFVQAVTTRLNAFYYWRDMKKARCMCRIA